MTATPLAAAAIAELEAEGVDVVIGTVVNPAGLTQAKAVPLRRTNTFADPGMGVSPVFHTFAIDQTGIAFTDQFGVVGDQRIRIDLAALRIVGDGLAWAPAAFYEQDGTPVPACARGTLGRTETALAEAGLSAVVGHELEFVLVDSGGSKLPSTLWSQYGLAGLLEHEAFARDVIATAAAAGVGIEQFHPEYGANQFEISLTPLSPVAAADQLVLARLIVGRVARRYGTRVSLSPVPFAAGIGCGAHQHFSLTASDGPLFSGGSGTRGMTTDGRTRHGWSATRPAGGAGHPVRVDRVRSALAARQLGRRIRLLGHGKPRGRSAFRQCARGGSGRRARRGEGRRRVRQPVFRVRSHPRVGAGRDRTPSRVATGNDGGSGYLVRRRPPQGRHRPDF